MIDMDQVEDFYEALSAAIESGLDTPGAHAVSDMYRAALALAEAAQAEASLRATERDRAIDRALSAEMQLEAAKAELKSTHDFYDLAIGVAQAHEARIDELKAQLAALQAAGEWRPVTDDDPTPLQRVVIETNDGADVGWRLPEMPHYWITRRGRSYLTEEIHGFKKLPPPQE